METTILSANDIGFLVEKVGLDFLMDELIARTTTAFERYDAHQCITPVRDGFDYTSGRNFGLVEWMPAMLAGDRVTIKIVGYHPQNPVRLNVPTVLSTVSVFDVASGHLMGLADATFLTALRTGAASAIASRALARPASRTLGLIGAGAQSCAHLHALSRLFEFERVLVYDVDVATSHSYASRVAPLGLDKNIQPSDLRTVVNRADILCTATSVDVGLGPVFEDEGLQPWVHINAIGADFPGKMEVPLSVLKRAFVFPDFLDQAMKDGECQRLCREDIVASLVDVVKSPDRYAVHRESISVFDSTGWALEDQVAMSMLMDFAQELNIGQRMALESMSPDPKNPYGFLPGHGAPNIRSCIHPKDQFKKSVGHTDHRIEAA
jgi:ornithine cyclodeaminase/alanine dehydrogenase-like protein (mu-crystallin family)